MNKSSAKSLCLPRFWFSGIRPGCKKFLRFPATAVEGGLFGRIGDRHQHTFMKNRLAQRFSRFVLHFVTISQGRKDILLLTHRFPGSERTRLQRCTDLPPERNTQWEHRLPSMVHPPRMWAGAPNGRRK